MPVSTAAAIVGSTVIGAGVSMSASSKAARAQQQAADQATQLQREMFEQNRADLAPWRTAGGTALQALMDMAGLDQDIGASTGTATGPSGPAPFNEAAYLAANPDVAEAIRTGQFQGEPLSQWKTAQQHYEMFGAREGRSPNPVAGDRFTTAPAGTNADGTPRKKYQFQASPGYAFRRDEGIKAIDRGASARGQLASGSRLKALTRFGDGLAADEFERGFSRLAGIAGVGQSATNTGVQLGQNYASTAGDIALQRGNARASGYIGQANGINDAINNGMYLAARYGGGRGGGVQPWSYAAGTSTGRLPGPV